MAYSLPGHGDYVTWFVVPQKDRTNGAQIIFLDLMIG
jgi:hypothetical protein